MASLAPVLASSLAQHAKPIVSGLADKATSGILGGVGGAIGGKTGKKVGKTIAKGLSSVRKSIFGFESGGKVRIRPVVGRGNMIQPVPAVIGYSVGGKVAHKKRGGRRKK
jgi:hypothetical protein